MNFLTKPVLYALVLIALILGGVAVTQSFRLNTEKLAHKTTKLDHAKVLGEISERSRKVADLVREQERVHTQHVSDILSLHSQEIEDAQTRYDRDVGALTTGTLQLQDRWRSCEARRNVPGAGPGTSAPSAADRDRYESAGRAVRASEQCDAQNKALIAIVIEDRAICNGKVPEVKP